MPSSEFGQFLLSVVLLLMAAMLVSAMLTPPDPFTQLVALAASLPLVVLASYVLSYRRGFEWV